MVELFAIVFCFIGFFAAKDYGHTMSCPHPHCNFELYLKREFDKLMKLKPLRYDIDAPRKMHEQFYATAFNLTISGRKQRKWQ